MNKKLRSFYILLLSLFIFISSFNSFVVIADSNNDFPYDNDDIEINDAINFLKSKQNFDGGIGGFTVSAWAAMAIYSADENLEEWTNLISYLEEKNDLLDANKATDWERQALAVIALDQNPRDFAGVNLVEKILDFYDGEQIGLTNNIFDDAYGILSLVSAGYKSDNIIIQNVKNTLINRQSNDGGWGDVDATASVIMALIAADVNEYSQIITDAFMFIKSKQTSNGGFGSWGGTNSASTAWGIMAISSTGSDPNDTYWLNNGNSPVDYLLNLQQNDGSFNYDIVQSVNAEWMTAYSITALMSNYYPVRINDTITDDNNAPTMPLTPTGENSGNTGKSYRFFTSALDPDGDNVQYRFDWDSECAHEYSSWTDHDYSGHTGSLTHIWKNPGEYVVKAQARDEYEKMSSWSDGITVNIRKENSQTDEDDDKQWGGYIRIEGKEETIWAGTVTVVDTSFEAVNVDTGSTDTYTILYPSVLGALIEASELGDFNILIEYWPGWNSFMVKTIKSGSDWWHYWVDYEIPLVGIDKYELTKYDSEVLFGYFESWAVHALKISTDKKTISKNEKVTITISNETDGCIQNSTIHVNSEFFDSNDEGKVIFSSDKSGKFYIYAEKDGFIRSKTVTINIKSEIDIVNPEEKSCYFRNTKLFGNLKKTWILGAITLKIDTREDIKKVEFYINNRLEYVDTESPFEYNLNKKSYFEDTSVLIKSYKYETKRYRQIKTDIFELFCILKQSMNNKDMSFFENIFDYFEYESYILSDSEQITLTVINLFPLLH